MPALACNSGYSSMPKVSPTTKVCPSSLSLLFPSYSDLWFSPFSSLLFSRVDLVLLCDSIVIFPQKVAETNTVQREREGARELNKTKKTSAESGSNEGNKLFFSCLFKGMWVVHSTGIFVPVPVLVPYIQHNFM